MMDNEQLVERAKQGDKDALVELIMAQKEDYYKLAYVYMRNKEDALDAMENMIVALYENIHRLKKNNSFYSWSQTILVNCCKSHLKRNKRIVSLESIKEESHGTFLDQKEKEIMIEKYLNNLNEKHREVIRLRYFLDYDYQTISNILKIPIGTVKSRISIGLRKLKKSMGGEYIE